MVSYHTFFLITKHTSRQMDYVLIYIHICTYILFEYGTIHMYLLDGPWASMACIDLMLDRAPRATMILEKE